MKQIMDSIELVQGPLGVLETPALVVFLTQEEAAGAPAAELADFGSLISPRLAAGDFKAASGETLILFPPPGQGPQRVILAGLGKREELNLEGVRRAAASGTRAALGEGRTQATLALPQGLAGLGGPGALARALALGALLGAYSYVGLKTKDLDKARRLERLALAAPVDAPSEELEEALAHGLVLAECVAWARDLVNTPANICTPAFLSAQAARVAGEWGLSHRVLSLEEAREQGMGALAAVAAGAGEEAGVIILEYQGARPGDRPTVLVGKAITFDSGGLSLKPAGSMENMKTDMAGGAAVLAALAAAARLGLGINLVGLVPATENMPSGESTRPGDVVRTLSGLSVEIVNTDAEGRLILADALTLAQRDWEPARLIDIATLTGAVSVALGDELAGLLTNDEPLAQALLAAGGRSGELLWRLPLHEPYFEFLKTSGADFKNSGNRKAGVITAGLFLKQFAGSVPWAHLDIAGTARADKDSPLSPAGGTAFGVRLLVELLEDLARGREEE